MVLKHPHVWRILELKLGFRGGMPSIRQGGQNACGYRIRQETATNHGEAS